MLKRDGYYVFENFIQFPQLIHGVSTREFGSMRNKRIVQTDNVENFLQAMQIPSDGFVQARQIHSGNIHVLQNAPKSLVNDTDGFVSPKKNIFMGIVTADCLPIFFYDPKKNIAGVVHAGYKGICNHIISNQIKKFEALGSAASDIWVGIGPGISVCCYEFGRDKIEMFQEIFPKYDGYFEIRNGSYFLDLKKLAVFDLLAYGIDKKKIEVSDFCTKDNLKEFYSYRGEGVETYGEFLSVIGLSV